jgi:membrane protease YdiL (CAAX protease family)
MAGEPGSDDRVAPAPGLEMARCWRCAKSIRRDAATCAHCGALRRRRSDASGEPRSDVTRPTTQVMVFFALFLMTSLVFGTLTSFGIQDSGPPTAAGARRILHLMLGVELIDAALVAAALVLVRRHVRWPPLATVPQPLLWLAAVAGVVVLVGVNAAYHEVLRRHLGLEPVRDAIVAANGITPLLVLAYCVQPAVIEELFFRRLALDTLRGVMPVHQAVFVSSLMFGIAHIGVPLSVPMLIVVGIPLAYARVATGGIALPMLIHFLHNAIILGLE